MEQNKQTTTAEPSEETVSASELVRPQEGRVLAGVSQGLADRYDLPVWVPRAFFVVTAFFGGLGVALYSAGWALIRSEDETESPADRFFSGATSTRSWIGIALVFVAALILLDNLTFLDGGVVWAVALLVVGVLLYTGQIPIRTRSDDKSKEGVQQMTQTDTEPIVAKTDAPTGDSPSGDGTPPTPTPTPPILPPSASKPKERSILGRLTMGLMLLGLGTLAVLDNVPAIPIDPAPRHYMALAVTILGVGLLVGAFAGRARWLILVGAVLIPTLFLSPVFEWDWNSETFDVLVEPDTFTDVEEFYSIDVGNLVIDLRGLPWDGETINITADVDIGNIEIRTPQDVGIVGEATVNIGRVGAPGRESTGLGNPGLDFDETGTEGTLILEAHVDVGNIDINR
ncbi:MAG: PspC domain-containing protein [Acidobacteria bacterium]|nr:PspC domain-containing protein [Acidobacteriota bacterium]